MKRVFDEGPKKVCGTELGKGFADTSRKKRTNARMAFWKSSQVFGDPRYAPWDWDGDAGKMRFAIGSHLLEELRRRVERFRCWEPSAGASRPRASAEWTICLCRPMLTLSFSQPRPGSSYRHSRSQDGKRKNIPRARCRRHVSSLITSHHPTDPSSQARNRPLLDIRILRRYLRPATRSPLRDRITGTARAKRKRQQHMGPLTARRRE
jgi:hypothetical protein